MSDTLLTTHLCCSRIVGTISFDYPYPWFPNLGVEHWAHPWPPRASFSLVPDGVLESVVTEAVLKTPSKFPAGWGSLDWTPPTSHIWFLLSLFIWLILGLPVPRNGLPDSLGVPGW